MGTPNTLVSPKIDKRARLYNHLKLLFEGSNVDFPGLRSAIDKQLGVTKGLVQYPDSDWPMVESAGRDFIIRVTDLVEDNSYILNYPKTYLESSLTKPKIVWLKEMPVNVWGRYLPRFNLLMLHTKYIHHDVYFLQTVVHEIVHWQDLLGTKPNNSQYQLGSEYNLNDWFTTDVESVISYLAGIPNLPIETFVALSQYAHRQVFAEIVARIKSLVALSSKYHSLEDIISEKGVGMFTPAALDRISIAWPRLPENKPDLIDIFKGSTIWD